MHGTYSLDLASYYRNDDSSLKQSFFPAIGTVMVFEVYYKTRKTEKLTQSIRLQCFLHHTLTVASLLYLPALILIPAFVHQLLPAKIR